MSDIMDAMIRRAQAAPKIVAFPEPENPDILRTAERVVAEGVGTPLFVGNRAAIEASCEQLGVNSEDFLYFDNTDEQLVAQLAEDFTSKYDDFSDKAVRRKSKSPLRCAMFLLRMGTVDCVAAGKDYSTGDVVFEASSIVGLTDGVESPSSIGIADIPEAPNHPAMMLGLADCAITAQPDASDLAGIAIASADTVRTLLGWTPRVAMLAFSTCGSAEHESIDVIRETVERVHELRPDISCDGEFQLDSAIIPATAARKVKRESDVAGQANVLVFPNLHAGNIGVKLIQLFGGANAYGPVLQGFKQPVCDFSRNAPVEEMLGNVAMLVVRAQDEGEDE